MPGTFEGRRYMEEEAFMAPRKTRRCRPSLRQDPPTPEYQNMAGLFDNVDRERAATWRGQTPARIPDLCFLNDPSDTDLVDLSRRQLAPRDGRNPLYTGGSPPFRSLAYDTFPAKTDSEACYEPVRVWNDPSPLSRFHSLPTPPPLRNFGAASNVAPNQKIHPEPDFGFPYSPHSRAVGVHSPFRVQRPVMAGHPKRDGGYESGSPHADRAWGPPPPSTPLHYPRPPHNSWIQHPTPISPRMLGGEGRGSRHVHASEQSVAPHPDQKGWGADLHPTPWFNGHPPPMGPQTNLQELYPPLSSHQDRLFSPREVGGTAYVQQHVGPSVPSRRRGVMQLRDLVQMAAATSHVGHHANPGRTADNRPAVSSRGPVVVDAGKILNPNLASSTTHIMRRGKERLAPKKKKISALKKVILRERAAKAAQGWGEGGDEVDQTRESDDEEEEEEEEVDEEEEGEEGEEEGDGGGTRRGMEELVALCQEGGRGQVDVQVAFQQLLIAQKAFAAAVEGVGGVGGLRGLALAGEERRSPDRDETMGGKSSDEGMGAGDGSVGGGGGSFEGDGSQRKATTYIGPDVHIRYCKQVISTELNRVTTELLKELLRFQERSKAKDPMKAKKKRRLVVGLREVSRAVRNKRAQCIIVAPNIEEITSEGGLDHTLHSILEQAEANEVEVVFALTKSKIAQAFGRRVRMSTVAICGYDGANELYKEMMKHAVAGREQWAAKHSLPPIAPLAAPHSVDLKGPGYPPLPLAPVA